MYYNNILAAILIFNICNAYATQKYSNDIEVYKPYYLKLRDSNLSNNISQSMYNSSQNTILLLLDSSSNTNGFQSSYNIFQTSSLPSINNVLETSSLQSQTSRNSSISETSSSQIMYNSAQISNG